jgi:hypothetical protein
MAFTIGAAAPMLTTRAMRASIPVLAALLVAGCNASEQPAQVAAPAPVANAVKAAAQPVAQSKPTLIAGALPVAAFVAEQLLRDPSTRTIVYVGASWCEPCQRFHRALQNGELDAALPGTRFIDYDYDLAKPALEADGYHSQLIPLFALPNSDGKSSGHSIEGSIKGDGAVGNIVPRLRELLATDGH